MKLNDLYEQKNPNDFQIGLRAKAKEFVDVNSNEPLLVQIIHPTSSKRYVIVKFIEQGTIQNNKKINIGCQITLDIKDLELIDKPKISIKVPPAEQWVADVMVNILDRHPNIKVTRRSNRDNEESHSYKPYTYEETEKIYNASSPYMDDQYYFLNKGEAIELFTLVVDKLAKELKRSFGGIVSQFQKIVFYVGPKQFAKTTDAFRQENGIVLRPNATTSKIMQGIVKYGNYYKK